jgi:hypothetical protein
MIRRIFRRGALLVLGVAIMSAGCAAISEQVEKVEEWGKGLQKEDEEKGSSSKGPEEAKQSAFYVHTVRWPGESLSIISKWYTGSLDQWTRIAKANPSVDPKRIHVGMKIRVPKEIMTNTKPMPQDFVASFYPEPAKGSDKPPPSAKPEAKEPTLIGPKSYSDQ